MKLDISSMKTWKCIIFSYKLHKNDTGISKDNYLTICCHIPKMLITMAVYFFMDSLDLLNIINDTFLYSNPFCIRKLLSFLNSLLEHINHLFNCDFAGFEKNVMVSLVFSFMTSMRLLLYLLSRIWNMELYLIHIIHIWI